MTRTFAGLLSGGSGFNAEDLFDMHPAEEQPITQGTRFRESRKGYTFAAGGRRWRVSRDEVGHNARLVVPEERDDASGSYYAKWEDGTLTISNLAKRGEFRPVGKPLVKMPLP